MQHQVQQTLAVLLHIMLTLSAQAAAAAAVGSATLLSHKLQCCL
jgi:hypothetical protein